jgi:glucan biosynthesis protein C
MSTPAASTEGFVERRYDLDWLRIGAFLLLILYHVGMYYVSWDFHVKSPNASRTIEPLMLLTSPWRMSLLFLISGVATSYLLEKGAHGFLGRRSVRLLVPLVFGMLVVVPPQSYFEVVEKVQYKGSYGDFLGLYLTAYQGFCRDGDCLILPTWNHLWFVAYLWVYTLVLYAAVRAVPSAAPRLREWLERRFVGLGLMLAPIVYLVAARMLLALSFPSSHALIDDWYNHAVYFGTFLLGFALAGTHAPWATVERLRWQALGCVAVGWAFLCIYHGLDAADALPAGTGVRRLWQLVYGAQQWLALVAVLGFARHHWNRDTAARRYLTTAIFPVYILHQTLIVIVAHALQPVALAPLLEGVLLVLVTVALCFLGYEAIRRIGVLRPLFGLAFAASVERLSPPLSRGAG